MPSSPLGVRNGHRSLWVERSKKDSVGLPIRPGDGLPVHTWPFASNRSAAILWSHWGHSGHRDAPKPEGSAANDPERRVAGQLPQCKGLFAPDVEVSI
jgi:hypothetical protein